MKQYEIKLDSILPLENKSDYFPDYVFESESIKVNKIYYFYYKFILNVFKIILKWRLKIMGYYDKKYKNDPLHKDVENIYTREAENYEYKHHLTTNFRDTWWRRWVSKEKQKCFL